MLQNIECSVLMISGEKVENIWANIIALMMMMLAMMMRDNDDDDVR